MPTDKLRGMDKAAIVLSNLGEEIASEVIKFLNPADIQLLGRRITSMEDVEPEKFIEVADEFNERIALDSGPGDAEEYVKNAVLKALGPDKASAILKRILKRPEGERLESLKWMDPVSVAELIKKEHPQTIAVIMASLSPEQAAGVFAILDQKLRNDVMFRVAKMDTIAPGAMDELEEAIEQNLSGSAGLQTSAFDGVKIAAEILNRIDNTTELEILAAIEMKDSALATEIEEEIFVFADIIDIDERGIQSILKNITNEQLILALKTADDALRVKFLGNMSERAKEMFVDEMESRGPVRLSSVDKAQLEIVRVTRRLAQEGELIIAGDDSGDLLV